MTEKPTLIDYADRAEFYELEHTETDDIPFLLAQIGSEVSSVLEAPCGVGRVTLPIAALGRSITALDKEPAMIERLATRARHSINGQLIEGVVADVRKVNLGRKYDLVMSPAEGIQLFLEDGGLTEAVVNLARHVDCGGRLLLDCATFDRDNAEGCLPSYFSPDAPDGKEFREWRKPVVGGATLTRWRTQWNQGEIVRFLFRYVLEHPNKPARHFRSELKLRRPDLTVIPAAAKSAGLRLMHLDGDRHGTPYQPGASRMVFQFQRPEPCSP